MPSIPNPDLINKTDTSLTTFTIEVNGEVIPATYNVVSIDISQTINQISFTRILLYDGDAAKQEFEISTGNTFETGSNIVVKSGYNLNEKKLFSGVVTKQRIKIKRSGGSLLYIEARDEAFKMTLDRKSRYFKELSDGDLFDQICQEYGISTDIELLGEPYPEIVQYQVSDWDFIVTRAERLGHYCLYSSGKLKIKKMVPSISAVGKFTYGVDILDADLELESRTQFESVEASAWDYTSQELIKTDISEVNDPDHGFREGNKIAEVGKVNPLSLKHSGSLTQQEIETWAEAQMIKSRFAKIRGTVKVQGTSGIFPGDSVELKGVGKRFSGNAFVSGIRHTIGDGNWTTTLQIGHSEKWHLEQYQVNSLPGAYFNPAINGLQIGVVTQLQEDPAGENRILVKIPSINNDDEGTWCRLALPDAGANRGIVWLPEIDDEVIVGFINDDPNYPVVLGMLHSSAKPSPLDASDDNHIKGIITRGDMRITFDDEKNILSLLTPSGNTIMLNEDGGNISINDENDNKIILDSNGITIESSKDIIMKAQGDIKTEGVNIKNSASAGFEAEGSASSKLSSSGTMDIKGSIVNIN
ncbi:type VI secretion system tip protein VgrG [Mangrovivirga sp. M17]|uniref:Type VI secretion system tip protein VgrG n=1 Tax=Mangrovivirga halotolerans TaxID=2993936 RepID=A0ABT3RQ00_9BACT|nr:type VI secretion system tip protein VgrG [Mangrovivirga halotolerans]MCX2743873.1 type VI secretion system tip protein VgrG [Mangrovivirga halotolerans]